jgi:hypothetical protein
MAEVQNRHLELDLPKQKQNKTKKKNSVAFSPQANYTD